MTPQQVVDALTDFTVSDGKISVSFKHLHLNSKTGTPNPCLPNGNGNIIKIQLHDGDYRSNIVTQVHFWYIS